MCDFLRATGQEADAYALALWRKAGGALTTIAMLLFSIPFVFGSVRAGLANRLVLASMLGMSVYLFDQIIANAGLLLRYESGARRTFPGLMLIADCCFLAAANFLAGCLAFPTRKSGYFIPICPS